MSIPPKSSQESPVSPADETAAPAGERGPVDRDRPKVHGLTGNPGPIQAAPISKEEDASSIPMEESQQRLPTLSPSPAVPSGDNVSDHCDASDMGANGATSVPVERSKVIPATDPQHSGDHQKGEQKGTSSVACPLPAGSHPVLATSLSSSLEGDLNTRTEENCGVGLFYSEFQVLRRDVDWSLIDGNDPEVDEGGRVRRSDGSRGPAPKINDPIDRGYLLDCETSESSFLVSGGDIGLMFYSIPGESDPMEPAVDGGGLAHEAHLAGRCGRVVSNISDSPPIILYPQKGGNTCCRPILEEPGTDGRADNVGEAEVTTSDDSRASNLACADEGRQLMNDSFNSERPQITPEFLSDRRHRKRSRFIFESCGIECQRYDLQRGFGTTCSESLIDDVVDYDVIHINPAVPRWMEVSLRIRQIILICLCREMLVRYLQLLVLCSPPAPSPLSPPDSSS